MPRMLAPIVYYSDIQWRALKTKARNNDPSLEPEEIQTINEVNRVHDAIIKGKKAKPRPEFQKSIGFDDKQVVKFFLGSQIERDGSHFHLIRTFYLPKRRPDGKGGKNLRAMDTLPKPIRNPRGNTCGFLLPSSPVPKALEANAKGNNEETKEDGLGEMIEGFEKDVSESLHGDTTGSTTEKKRRSRRSLPHANASNLFVRRSSRRIGGAAEQDNEELDELKDYETRSGSSTLDATVSGTPAPSSPNNSYLIPYQQFTLTKTGSEDSGVGIEMTSNALAASSTNFYPLDTFTSPRKPYKSPYPSLMANEEVDNESGSNSTLSTADNDEFLDAVSSNGGENGEIEANQAMQNVDDQMIATPTTPVKENQTMQNMDDLMVATPTTPVEEGLDLMALANSTPKIITPASSSEGSQAMQQIYDMVVSSPIKPAEENQIMQESNDLMVGTPAKPVESIQTLQYAANFVFTPDRPVEKGLDLMELANITPKIGSFFTPNRQAEAGVDLIELANNTPKIGALLNSVKKPSETMQVTFEVMGESSEMMGESSEMMEDPFTIKKEPSGSMEMEWKATG